MNLACDLLIAPENVRTTWNVYVYARLHTPNINKVKICWKIIFITSKRGKKKNSLLCAKIYMKVFLYCKTAEWCTSIFIKKEKLRSQENSLIFSYISSARFCELKIFNVFGCFFPLVSYFLFSSAIIPRRINGKQFSAQFPILDFVCSLFSVKHRPEGNAKASGRIKQNS